MTTNTRKLVGISFATQYTEQILQFLSVVVLARILSPRDIGAYSVAAFLMTLLHVFRDFGVAQYIIQEKNLNSDKIRSAMGVAILLALAVSGAMVACSGFVARLYATPELANIMHVMAASFAISPFGSLVLGVHRREMRLKAIFYLKLVNTLVHITVSVSLALYGLGAISLAWANFAGIVAFGLAANVTRPKDLPWLPRFSNIREVLSFGSMASVGNAANIAGANLPEVIIGKAMNIAAAGYFSRANGVVQLYTKLIAGSVMPLMLPYFAQMRRENKNVAPIYVMSIAHITAIAWPFFIVLSLLAYPLVRTLYGMQWDESVPTVKLLCIAGAISSLSVFSSQAMVAIGHVRSSTFSQLISQPFRVAAILLTATYGLQMVATALIVSELISLIAVSWFLYKTVEVRLSEVLRACGKSAVIAVFSSVLPLGVHILWGTEAGKPWIPAFVGVAGAAIGWIAGVLWMRHPLADHLLPVLRAFVPLAGRKKENQN